MGNPLRIILTGGQAHDVTKAEELLIGFDPEKVIGDKAYDADHFLAAIYAIGAEPVIPPKSNRLDQREYDRQRYKDRNLVERFFNRIKQFRRIATRYDKLDRNYEAMIQLVCTLIWLT